MTYKHLSYFNSISDSNARIIRKYLRYDTQLGTAEAEGHQDTLNRTSRRGQWLNRRPAEVLDFDHDGKRDLAWWFPPTAAGVDGTFEVRLSGGGTLVKSMGRLGDIPVPSDFNGDGATDLAVFIPGGGINHDTPTATQAFWRYCPTNYQSPSTACLDGSISTYQFGEREDVPLPGLDFDGLASTGHLAVFRPSARLWVWGPVASYNPSTARSVTVGDATTLVPLPGLYDLDNKTDIVG